MKKIYILGHCGAGTTHLSKIISSKLKIKAYDMDDVRFIKKFTKARTPEQRKVLVDKILKNNSWVIDARGTGWDRHAMLESDLILWLRTPAYKRVFRILKRYFGRRKNPNFHEKFSDMFTLIRYTLSFRSGTKVSSLKPLNKYLSENNLSPTIIRTNRQVRKWLKELEKRV
jgi:adenylate kinase family enzyme